MCLLVFAGGFSDVPEPECYPANAVREATDRNPYYKWCRGFFPLEVPRPERSGLAKKTGRGLFSKGKRPLQ